MTTAAAKDKDKPAETTKLDTYRPPAAVVAAGIHDSEWLTMRNLYPGAKPESVLMIWHYCKARRLDPFKKPCHLVPMRVKEGSEWKTRDVVLPGIYEYRITAHRTGEYRGHDKPTYGVMKKIAGVEAPEFCEFIAHRGPAGSNRSTWASFPVTVWFHESVTRKSDGDHANDRWSDAPRQMLTKCAEAAALREAFPEEMGGVPTAEEMDGKRVIESSTVTESIPARPLPPRPEGFDDWRDNLSAVAETGLPALEKMWADSAREYREFLNASEPETWDNLRERAGATAGETIE